MIGLDWSIERRGGISGAGGPNRMLTPLSVSPLRGGKRGVDSLASSEGLLPAANPSSLASRTGATCCRRFGDG